jgi:lipoprotein NlpD
MKTITSLLLTAALLAAGCTSTRHRAPVEERGTVSRPQAAASAPATQPAAAADPRVTPTTTTGPDPAVGRPGTYVVKPGDTLIRIGLETGQNWRDIARWSGLENPNVIEVGQTLRVLPPGIEPGAPVTQPVVAGAKPEVRPLTPGAPTPATTASTPGAAASAPVPAVAPPAPKDPDEDLNWLWPAAGPVLTAFDDAKSKGVAIGGKQGDAVLSAADGRVVYAGSGLRGYGNLVIVKHNNTFLTAYAHNQALLVKEDQVVRRGQKIAEMGSSDADRVQLHFEIRRQGKPVDPTRYLPAR